MGTKTAGRPKLSEEAQAAFAKKIISIAQELYFENGFESVSMRKIAQRANCSPMTIYYYFENKHAILQKIWVAIFDEAYDILKLPEQSEMQPLDKLRSVARAYIDYWLQHPEYFHLVYLTVDAKSISLGDAVLNTENSNVRKSYNLIEELIANCVEKNLLVGSKPTVMGQILYSSIYGMLLCPLRCP